ncbi:unnamed protein product, partial [Closterium sp. NIES-64]
MAVIVTQVKDGLDDTSILCNDDFCYRIPDPLLRLNNEDKDGGVKGEFERRADEDEGAADVADGGWEDGAGGDGEGGGEGRRVAGGEETVQGDEPTDVDTRSDATCPELLLLRHGTHLFPMGFPSTLAASTYQPPHLPPRPLESPSALALCLHAASLPSLPFFSPFIAPPPPLENAEVAMHRRVMQEIANLTALLEGDPGNAHLLLERGKAWFSMHRFPEAIADRQRAVALLAASASTSNPYSSGRSGSSPGDYHPSDLPRALLSLGQALHAAGRVQEAVEANERAAVLLSSQNLTSPATSAAATSAEDSSAAASSAEWVTVSAAWGMVGLSYHWLPDADKAERAFRLAVEADPRNPTSTGHRRNPKAYQGWAMHRQMTGDLKTQEPQGLPGLGNAPTDDRGFEWVSLAPVEEWVSLAPVEEWVSLAPVEEWVSLAPVEEWVSLAPVEEWVSLAPVEEWVSLAPVEEWVSLAPVEEWVSLAPVEEWVSLAPVEEWVSLAPVEEWVSLAPVEEWVSLAPVEEWVSLAPVEEWVSLAPVEEWVSLAPVEEWVSLAPVEEWVSLAPVEEWVSLAPVEEWVSLAPVEEWVSLAPVEEWVSLAPVEEWVSLAPVEEWVSLAPVEEWVSLAPVEEWVSLAPVEEWVSLAPVEEWVSLAPVEEWVSLAPVEEWVSLAPVEEWVSLAPVEEWVSLAPVEEWVSLAPVEEWVSLAPVEEWVSLAPVEEWVSLAPVEEWVSLAPVEEWVSLAPVEEWVSLAPVEEWVSLAPVEEWVSLAPVEEWVSLAPVEEWVSLAPVEEWVSLAPVEEWVSLAPVEEWVSLAPVEEWVSLAPCPCFPFPACPRARSLSTGGISIPMPHLSTCRFQPRPRQGRRSSPRLANSLVACMKKCFETGTIPLLTKWVSLAPVEEWASLAPVEEWVSLAPVEEWVSLAPVEEWISLAPVEEWASLAPVEEWVSLAPVEEWVSLAPVEEWISLAPVEEWVSLAPVEEWASLAPVEEWVSLAPLAFLSFPSPPHVLALPTRFSSTFSPSKHPGHHFFLLTKWFFLALRTPKGQLFPLLSLSSPNVHPIPRQRHHPSPHQVLLPRPSHSQPQGLLSPTTPDAPTVFFDITYPTPPFNSPTPAPEAPSLSSSSGSPLLLAPSRLIRLPLLPSPRALLLALPSPHAFPSPSLLPHARGTIPLLTKWVSLAPLAATPRFTRLPLLPNPSSSPLPHTRGTIPLLTKWVSLAPRTPKDHLTLGCCRQALGHMAHAVSAALRTGSVVELVWGLFIGFQGSGFRVPGPPAHPQGPPHPGLLSAGPGAHAVSAFTRIIDAPSDPEDAPFLFHAFYQREIATLTAKHLESSFSDYSIEGAFSTKFLNHWAYKKDPRNLFPGYTMLPQAAAFAPGRPPRRAAEEDERERARVVWTADLIGGRVQYSSAGNVVNRRAVSEGCWIAEKGTDRAAGMEALAVMQSARVHSLLCKSFYSSSPLFTYRHPPFTLLFPKWQHRAAGMAALEVMQSARATWRWWAKRKHKHGLTEGRRAADPRKNEEEEEDEEEDEEEEEDDEEEEEEGVGMVVDGWRGVFDIGARWRQLVDPCEPVLWMERVRSVDSSLVGNSVTPISVFRQLTTKYVLSFPHFPLSVPDSSPLIATPCKLPSAPQCPPFSSFPPTSPPHVQERALTPL